MSDETWDETTRPTLAAKQRRLEQKSQRAEIKAARSKRPQ